MKAISFLEYYELTYTKEPSESKLIYDVNRYYEKVSQSFSFEKVVELFEGFTYSINIVTLNPYVLYDWKGKVITIELKENKIIIDSSYIDDLPYDLTYDTNIPIKTIDEFIVLCNNLNIELEWK